MCVALVTYNVIDNYDEPTYEPVQKRLVSSSDYDYFKDKTFVVNSERVEYYLTDRPVGNNSQDIDDYYYVNNTASGDTMLTTTYSLNGSIRLSNDLNLYDNFNIKVIGSYNSQYNRYEYRINEIYLIYENSINYLVQNSTAQIDLSGCVVYCDNIIDIAYPSNYLLIPVSDLSPFELVFDEYNGTNYYFNSDYNFGRLTSEIVTSSRLIVPYNNRYNDEPSDVVIRFAIKCDFISNNYLYRGMWLELVKPIYVRYQGQDLQVNERGSLSQLLVRKVYYLNEWNDNIRDYSLNETNSVLACSRHIYGYKSYNTGVSEVQAPIFSSGTIDWANEIYRYINISNQYYDAQYSYACVPNDNTMWNSYLYNGLTLSQVLIDSAGDGVNIGSYTYGDTDVGLSNVFVLFGDAFTSIIPFLSIQIIPGITVGLLCFMPLIATLIIVIVRLLKK